MTSGDMMRDRFNPGAGCGRIDLFGMSTARPWRQEGTGSGPHPIGMILGRRRRRSISSGGLRNGLSERPEDAHVCGRESVFAKAAQDMMRPTADLTGPRQTRPVVIETFLALPIIGAVRRRAADGALGGLVEGPPQCLGPRRERCPGGRLSLES